MSKVTHTLLKRILQEEGEIKYVEPVSKIMFNDVRAYVFTEKNYFRYYYYIHLFVDKKKNQMYVEYVYIHSES